MKKSLAAHILCVFVLLLASSSAYAQNETGHMEIGGGIGTASSDYLFDGYSPGLLGGGKKEYVNQQYSGAYFITAKYYITRRFAISIVAAYENERGDWQKNYNYDHFGYQSMRIGTFKRQAFTFSPEVTFNYSNNGLIRTYFAAGMGFTYRNEIGKYSTDYYYSSSNFYNGVNTLGSNMEVDNSKVQGNFYFSPFGISIGSKVRWFAEIGVGYKGVLNTGFSVKL